MNEMTMHFYSRNDFQFKKDLKSMFDFPTNKTSFGIISYISLWKKEVIEIKLKPITIYHQGYLIHLFNHTYKPV